MEAEAAAVNTSATSVGHCESAAWDSPAVASLPHIPQLCSFPNEKEKVPPKTGGPSCFQCAVSVHQTSRKEKPPIQSKERPKVARNHLESLEGQGLGPRGFKL